MDKNIIIDTGFWYALFDERDDYYTEAHILKDHIENLNIILPWPSLYETLNTRFVKRNEWLQNMNYYISRENTIKLDDTPYRDQAINQTINNLSNNKRYSLVDIVIRSMLDDPYLHIHALLTFNPSDFYNICDRRSIEMLYR